MAEILRWKAGGLFAGDVADAAWATLGVDVTGLDLEAEAEGEVEGR